MLDRSRLIQRLSEDGYSVTARQLQGWAAAGLIPKPEVRRMGRGKGVAALYPELVVPQIACLVEALAEHRCLDYARLVLWRAGYPVDVLGLFERGLDTIRQFQRRVREDREAVKRYVESSDAGLDDAYRTLDEIPLDPHDTPVLRAVHGALKSRDVKYANLVFLSTIPHEPDAFNSLEENDDRLMSTTARALARLVNFPFPRSLSHLLDGMRPYFQVDNLVEILADSNAGVLLQADTDFRAMLLVINALFGSFNHLRHKPIKPLFALEQQPPELQTALVLIWHSFMQSPRLRAGFERVMQSHQQCLSSY